jgi:hypothetical protein
MIPLSRIVDEIEKHVSTAKVRDDESGFRESLIAIRALCDVALGESSKMYQPARSLEPQPIQTSEPIKEEDANGDSLFDF